MQFRVTLSKRESFCSYLFYYYFILLDLQVNLWTETYLSRLRPQNVADIIPARQL